MGVEDILHWWNKLSSCFYAPDRGCASDALGILSVLCTIMSCLILLCSRYKLRDRLTPTSTVRVLYCLIGNLCNVAGALLSHQLLLQIVMASLLAAMDVLHLISITLLVCLWRHSKSGRRVRMVTRRRRQNSFAVCLLFAMGGCVYLSKGVHNMQPLSIRSPTSRKLLNVFLHDGIELLGYVLGLLSFAISWTSRFPLILKASRGDLSNPTTVSSLVLSALAAALYASAILLYDTQLEAMVKALPWILSGAGCAVLEIVIMGLACYRIRYKRPTGLQVDSDSQSLLGTSSMSSQHYNPRDAKARKQLLPSRSSNSPKMTEMGSYMDVNVQPVRKVCLKEVTVSREGSEESQRLKRSVKVVRVDECYSSGSLTDTSSISSELEWDFQETAPHWRSQNGQLQNAEAFPLQEWMVAQKPETENGTEFHAAFCHQTDKKERVAETNMSLSDYVK